MTALLRFQPRKGSGRVNQGHHRAIELLSQLHQAECLAVTLWVGHAEVAVLAHFGVGSFLLTNEHHTLTVDEAKSTYHGLVVFDGAVTVQLHEVPFGQCLDVVQGVWTIGVAADLHPLPWGQIRIHLLRDLPDFALQILRQGLHVHIALLLQFFRLDKLFAQLANRLFKFEVIHAYKVLQRQRCNIFLTMSHRLSPAC